MLLTWSATGDNSRFARIGYDAPSLVAEHQNKEVSLEQLRGKKVILSFWSAADAESRLMQTKIAQLQNRTNGKTNKITIMSVNLDRSETLMHEMVKIDNLDESSQFYVGSKEHRNALLEAYRMGNGLRTFIIDENGHIMAVDPTDTQLAQLLS